ncbi:hypothetical protein O0I10_000956 [Lichtheimia ornata]|uniref:Uncharacterized protein n=1 Tax=Lichtheimia ornata TaxID=688661 RepID=A0AAD8DJK5_9FUNG|nr:uncharacterized protein O0I10_000956 [Lichtheimia ornata]KAJ8663707.1 hypothetical protein O0I10_000956 [Lichtheimia ornata]
MRESNMFKALRSSIGQRRPSPFATLPSFHGYTFFPMDIMHLLGHGIAHQLWNMMQGTYGKNNNPLYLSPATRNTISQQLIASSQTTPSSFSGSCGDIKNKSGYFRAVDWIHFARFLLPTVLLGSDDQAKRCQVVEKSAKGWTTFLKSRHSDKPL